MKGTVTVEMPRGRLTIGKVVWAVSFLVAATWALDRIVTAALLNVLRRHALTSYWPSVLTRQTFLVAMTVLSAELAVVLYFYRPWEDLFSLPLDNNTEKEIRHKFATGVLGGVCTFVASTPFLLLGDKTHTALTPIHVVAPQLLYYPVSLSAVCQIVLMLGIVPILAELVFRGIVLRSLWDFSSFWPAAAGSSLLFAVVWPVPTVCVAVLLGIASSLVFRQTRALVSSIITNTTLMILVEAVLIARDLHVF